MKEVPQQPSITKRSDLLEPIFFEDRPDVTPEERFQNTVLRPVLKFQNASLCMIAVEAVKALNPAFMDLHERKQRQFLTSTLTSNLALRNQLLGMVLGMLDEPQIKEYLILRKEYSKRIQAMLLQRIVEQYMRFLKS